MNKIKQYLFDHPRLGRTYLILIAPIIFPLQLLVKFSQELWLFVSNIPYIVKDSTKPLYRTWKESWDKVGMSPAELTRIDILEKLKYMPPICNFKIDDTPYKQWFQDTYNEPFDVHVPSCDCHECEGY